MSHHHIGDVYLLQCKSEPMTLRSLKLSPPRWCWKGEDLLDPGGELLGEFVRVKPNGKAKWATAPMAHAKKVAEE